MQLIEVSNVLFVANECLALEEESLDFQAEDGLDDRGIAGGPIVIIARVR